MRTAVGPCVVTFQGGIELRISVYGEFRIRASKRRHDRAGRHISRAWSNDCNIRPSPRSEAFLHFTLVVTGKNRNCSPSRRLGVFLTRNRASNSPSGLKAHPTGNLREGRLRSLTMHVWHQCGLTDHSPRPRGRFGGRYSGKPAPRTGLGAVPVPQGLM